VNGPSISPSQFKLLVVGLVVGLFLSSTEQSVVATALPTMAGELGGGNRISWVVSAYLLTSAIVTPLYGKLSDLFGRRPVYQASILVFLVGTVLCGLSQSMNQLVAARAVQGLGGGGLMSLAFIILGDVVSPRERGRYIGVFTAVFTVSAVTGPLWGGVLVDTAGWRWVFLAIAPVAFVALLITRVALRLPFATRNAAIDWLGGALLTVATTGLLLVPIWGGDTYAWTSPQVLGAAVIGLGATALFAAQERRAPEPVVPLRLLRNRTVTAVMAMGFLLMFGLMSSATFLPLFLQIATGATATVSGLMMIPQSIAISAAATIAGNLVSRSGRYKWTLVAGPALAALGMALLSTIDTDTTALGLAPILVVLGSGLGMTFPHLTLAVQNAADVSDLGAATSTANFFRALGATFGAAAAGSVVTVRLANRLERTLDASRLEQLGGAEGLIRSPRAVKEFPDELRETVTDAVAGAVSGVFLYIVPLMLVILAFGLSIEERPLRTGSSMGSTGTASSEPTGTEPASGD
jgi:EmrB/QacA subfamily drug resistance transporter